jgi:pyruvate formate lyase activating enzyme
MGIKGFQGTSLLDFPGRIASLVFWGGCNLTCPFCHNPALVLEPETLPDLDPGELLADLAARRTFIDGIVVSGGEPTLDRALPGFLAEVKALGLAVKLDTNGLAPQVVGELVARRLVDYLAIDLKTALGRYPELHVAAVAPGKLIETIELCGQAQVELEYRTTCVPGWVDEQVITAAVPSRTRALPECTRCRSVPPGADPGPGRVRRPLRAAGHRARDLTARHDSTPPFSPGPRFGLS